MIDPDDRYATRLLHAALVAGGVGIWQWEPETGAFRISPQLESLFGLVAGQFPGTRDSFVSLLDPVDRQRFVHTLETALLESSVAAIEFRVSGGDGQPRWFNCRGEGIRELTTGAIHFAGTIQAIAATIVAERRMRRQQMALLELVTHDWLRDAPLEEALARVSASAADTLEVARVGIWLYDEARRVMHCTELFDRESAAHTHNGHFDAADYPKYFEALHSDRAIAVSDALADPRTAELAPGYLTSLGIASMLDAPIRRAGVQVGIVCHEHIGPQRIWTLDEQNFAASIADLVAGLLGADHRRRIEQQLRASEERYRAFIEHSTEAIWHADLDPPVPVSLQRAELIERIEAQTVLTECNAVMAHLLGYAKPAGVVGIHLAELSGEKRSRVVAAALIDAGFRLRDLEVASKTKDGLPVWFSVSMIGVIEQGALVRIWGMWRDVTDRRLALDALEHQTLHDSLTGLPNRKWLSRELAHEIEVAARESRHIALMLIDLDHFKEVNDTLGHYAGDQLLRAIGPRLATRLAACDGALVRLGGDEFAVLARQVLRARDAEAIAIQLLEEIRQPFTVEGARLEVGASIGIALYPQHGEDVSSLLRRADVAMYVAKKHSRGYTLYRAEDDLHSPRRLDLLSELGAAIRNSELALHYQPKIHFASGAVSGFEALVRWPHPRHGMVPPDEFVRLAEMGDLITPLTSWVIGEALRQWTLWAGTGFRPRLSINLSARNLADELTLLDLGELLDRHAFPPERLELELTESAFLVDPKRALGVLRKMAALGVKLAIDDFGTGFSSLSYLCQMPIHALKIDKTFVIRMQESVADQTIIQSTINLAHNLGFTVVAEGIETESAAAALQAMGCDHGQGYWIARPMPGDAVAQWCSDARWRCVDD
ncbi:MAG: EAL domain-containing protein [Betaproteobacteria bacterium]